MATKTYKVVIDVDSKDVEQLEQQLKDVGKEVQEINTEVGALEMEDKFKAATGGIKVMTGALTGAVGTLGLLGVESEVFGEFEKKAASAIAVAIGFKDVSEGMFEFVSVAKKAGGAAKLFGITTKKALIATGIGAFVVLLGTMIAYWDDISAAIKKAGNNFAFIGKAMDTLKAGFNSLIERFRPILEFLGLVPTLEEAAAEATRKAAETAIPALEKQIELMKARGATAEEVYEAEKKLGELRVTAAKKEEDIEKAAHQLALTVAAEQKRLDDEKRQRRQEAAAERKKQEEEAAATAIENEKEATNFLKQLKEAELDFLAKTDEQKLQLQYDRIQSEIDQLQVSEERKAEIKLQAEENYQNELAAIKEAAAVAEKENLALKTQELEDILTEYRIANIEDVFLRAQEELRIEQEKEIARLTALNATEAQIAEVKRYYTNQMNQITAEQTAWEMMNAEAKKQFITEAAAQTFGNLSKILGEESKAGKVAAIAEAIIRTYQAANAAYASLAVIPIVGPALGAIAAAAAIAAGIANVKKIKSTKVYGEGGGTGGPNIPGGGGAPAAPSFNASQMGQISAPQAENVQPTVRAYVLSGDARSAQEADAKLNARRSLG